MLLISKWVMYHGKKKLLFDEMLMMIPTLLTRKLLNQGFFLVKLKSSLIRFYDRHHDLVDRYGISVSQMTTVMFHLS